MVERRVLPLRVSDSGHRAVENVASRHGITKSDAARWMLAFAYELPVKLDEFIRSKKSAAKKARTQ